MQSTNVSLDCTLQLQAIHTEGGLKKKLNEHLAERWQEVSRRLKDPLSDFPQMFRTEMALLTEKAINDLYVKLCRQHQIQVNYPQSNSRFIEQERRQSFQILPELSLHLESLRIADQSKEGQFRQKGHIKSKEEEKERIEEKSLSLEALLAQHSGSSGSGRATYINQRTESNVPPMLSPLDPHLQHEIKNKNSQTENRRHI